MKHNFHSGALLVLLFILLIFCSNISARVIKSHEGQEKQKLNEITTGISVAENEANELMNFMGLEACENGDEECFKRRIMSEAHLDYIYTQHQKP